MRCEFRDGMEIEYAGTLSVAKGEDFGVVLNAGDIPAGFKSYLESAARYNSCRELRTIAQEVTAAVGGFPADE